MKTKHFLLSLLLAALTAGGVSAQDPVRTPVTPPDPAPAPAPVDGGGVICTEKTITENQTEYVNGNKDSETRIGVSIQADSEVRSASIQIQKPNATGTGFVNDGAPKDLKPGDDFNEPIPKGGRICITAGAGPNTADTNEKLKLKIQTS